ncbi:MAG: S41 family peptidase [Candidatus Aminicenantes bacterium]|jgi:carboxyl-terminal processing protease
MKKLNRIAFFSLIALVLFFIFVGKKIFQPLPEAKREFDYLSLISEVVSLVKTDYVEEIQPGEKFPGAFSRMLRTLDQSCTYLDAPKTKIYQLYQQGKTYHCGIYGAKRSHYFYISDILPDSPAQTHGIKPGDTIKAINGKSVFEQSFWEIYLSLQTDKPGTIEIALLENEGNTSTPNKIKLETVIIDTSLKVKEIKDNIYLVELPRIDAKNTAHLKQTLKNELSLRSPLKLVMDLRKYSGGELKAFLELTKLFFPHSLPLTLKTKHQEEKLLVGSTQAITYQAVVIINKSTRMYGELLAALFKEYARENVTLMGAKTRGLIAGIKQFPLSDGSSILLTRGIFLLKGKNPANTGVSPDVKVKEKDSAAIIDRAVAVLEETHD